MRLPGTLPFTPRTVTAATRNGMVVGTTDHTEFRVYDSNGALQMIVRNVDTFIEITSRDQQYVVDSLRERYADNLNNPEIDFMIRTTAESRLPEFFPTYDSLAVDLIGNVWVEMFRRPGETNLAWDVYDPDGLYLGPVRGPEGFRATEIGDNYMLGIWTATDGTARVRKYGILKP